jgi:hypothetical protein
MAALEQQGLVVGMDEWIHETVNREAERLPDTISELLGARHALQEAQAASPSSRVVVDVGSDARTKGKSFDVIVEQGPVGGPTQVTRRIEFFSPDENVGTAGGLMTSVFHAAGKIPKAVADGTQPRPPGTYEAGMRLKWPPDTTPLGANERVFDAAGNWTTRNASTHVVYKKGNLIDDLAGTLNKLKDPKQLEALKHLDFVNIFDMNGNLISRLKNKTPGQVTPGQWVREGS